ncbi:MAG: helicase-associated domain-containing protein [Anaerolineae bacterium]|nr:helicase-associated domain-containing protein [Anaerolineae bacterium]
MSLRTLYQTLLDSDFARLRVIAQQWEISLASERRDDAAAELADSMARAEAVEAALARLPEGSRAALDDLLRRGGAMPWTILARRWGELRSVGPGRLEREELWREPVSAVEDLWYRGLIQRAFEEREIGQVEMAFVPEELLLYIPSPPSLQWTLPDPVAPPLSQAQGTDRLADDMVSLWAVLQAEAVVPSATPLRALLLHLMPVPAATSSAASSPSVASTIAFSPVTLRLKFVETLALEQGWIRANESGDVLRIAPEPVLAWLQKDAWSQWVLLARAWVESRRWNDLIFVPTLRPDPVKGWPGDPWRIRREILTMLQRCKPDAWYLIEQFADFVREYAADFLRPDGDYEAWALRDALTDKPLRGFAAWDAVEGALVSFILTGPLFWLGLVDLGAPATALPWTAFRLTPAGAALLGSRDVAPEPSPWPAPPLPAVQLNGDGVLHVPARRRYERFQLHRVAHPMSPDGEMYPYRLTSGSLARARQQRISLERVIAFLEDVTGSALPQHFRQAIERAYNAETPVATLERVWLLRVADSALVAQLEARYLLREELGPGLFLVHASDRERLLAVLTRKGILAEFEDS